MRGILPRQPWHQAWAALTVYGALSSADYVLSVAALSTGRMGFTPSATGPYEANPIAVWLFAHEGAGAVLGYKALAVAVGAGLLLISRPMWSRYAWVRAATVALLWAGVAWELLGVGSGIAVLVGV